MSWQAYIDQSLIGSNKIAKAAIYTHQKGECATSSGFKLNPDEVDALINAFNDPSPFYASGIHLGGQKYIPLRCSDESIYLKQGSSGACCVKTKQLVIVGVYADGVQPGEANVVVEKLGDYLRGVNY
ncbi:uncharacterized protein VTP21DRAFT_9961 [Calcarisporiella thermophila]|uniref:uncharacterized protein n=1 Tax=Calcarisporiella thermophila TaxID=911321 RepID=UPI003742EB5F